MELLDETSRSQVPVSLSQQALMQLHYNPFYGPNSGMNLTLVALLGDCQLTSGGTRFVSSVGTYYVLGNDRPPPDFSREIKRGVRPTSSLGIMSATYGIV